MMKADAPVMHLRPAMLTLYSLLLRLALPVIRVAAVFNHKLRRALDGRAALLKQTKEHYDHVIIGGPRILIHSASFGELEQAKPVIAEIKKQFPTAHIHLTFFSPSGYENTIGKYSDADFISYSPIDLPTTVAGFLDIVNPDLALFARYDVWPNMGRELKHRNIPSILFAATASDSSGRMMPLVSTLYKNVFRGLTKILALSERDKKQFEKFGVDAERVVVAGDTRFDQVLARRASIEYADDSLLPPVIRRSIEDRGTLVFVVGSSWPADEAIYLDTITQSNERGDNILTIIAPHEPSEERVRALLARFPGKAIRYSDIQNWSGEPVIVVDSIGKLFGLYRLADIAMIGGGFGAGLHNILEAAVWGVATIVGPKHGRSQEVQQLIDRLAAFEVTKKQEFDFAFWQLARSEELRHSSGELAAQYVEENRGATERIMKEIAPLLH
jgi:3-deoxy-D-manno-octulosonic-acid transferase